MKCRNFYFINFYSFFFYRLFVLIIIISFIGYVLPWGQISFWGATVITNLISSIPYLGDTVVIWVWGGFSVDSPTLSRFFRLHFILPFLLVIIILVHLINLHKKGSSNPLGLRNYYSRISFFPYFSFKDLLMLIVLLLSILLLIFFFSSFF